MMPRMLSAVFIETGQPPVQRPHWMHSNRVYSCTKSRVLTFMLLPRYECSIARRTRDSSTIARAAAALAWATVSGMSLGAWQVPAR